MSRHNPFRGLGIALATPFTADGAVDHARLTALVNHVTDGGADFLCVLGTTAETPTLTPEEKRRVMATVIAANAGRLPLLLGAGGNCTAAVTDYLKQENLTGIDGVLIVAPFYNKPSQRGLAAHFKAVAQATDKAVVLYNVPSRTGVNVESATTLEVARACPNVVAVKEASGRIGQIEEIVEGAPEGFEVLSGDDAITFELLTIGAVGVISVVGNAYPKAFSTMVHAVTERVDYTEALRVHRSLSKAYRLLSADGNPSGIKALLSVRGQAENVLRLPLVPAREETVEALRTFDAAFGA